MWGISRFTADVGGYPFLYADTFMTQEEFEKMFDLTAYEQVRHKYMAEGAFPHLHNKVSRSLWVSILQIEKNLQTTTFVFFLSLQYSYISFNIMFDLVSPLHIKVS